MFYQGGTIDNCTQVSCKVAQSSSESEYNFRNEFNTPQIYKQRDYEQGIRCGSITGNSYYIVYQIICMYGQQWKGHQTN